MKQKSHTPFITGLLKKTLGSDSDHGNIPVFEVVATSSRPLKKKGLYQNAVLSTLTLAQMAQWIAREPIPLMMDHNMEGTPKGKFFYAEMRADDGVPELRGLMYIDPTEIDLVNKANLGTLDETSVGFLPSSIKCSACGFDYMAALKEDNYEPLVTLTCDKGHKLGTNGVHSVVDGIEDFMELSLVSRGAAPYSKIIGNDNAKLGEHIEKLAASGYDVSDLYLTASASEGENKVDITELVAQLSDVKAEKITLSAEIAAANAKATAAEARVAELEAELETAKAELEAAKEAVAPSEDAEALQASRDFLGKQYVAVLAAAGETDVEAPESVKEMIEGIEAHRAKLSAILPVGGVSLTNKSQDNENEVENQADARLSAFKRPNK